MPDMNVTYQNYQFDIKYVNETTRERYSRLLKEFKVKSAERFPGDKNMEKVLKSLINCPLIFKKYARIHIEILARLNFACDHPENTDNLIQLAMVTKETPYKELLWDCFKAICGFLLAYSPMLIPILHLTALFPPALLPVIVVCVAFVGGSYGAYHLLNLHCKEQLQDVKRNIHNVNFFLPPQTEQVKLNTFCSVDEYKFV